jgi:tetratricopeptide (TPR) repeat protein
VAPLEKALAVVSNDYESHYYLGLALLGQGDNRRARLSLERSQSYGTFRAPSLIALAGLTAREGDRERALELLRILTREDGKTVRGGGLEAAMLRALGNEDLARVTVERWLVIDPTSSFLRHEAVLLGMAAEAAEETTGALAGGEDALWRHLAADPERILEIAVDYMRLGLYDDAVTLLARRYPSGAGVVAEPGMPRPEHYPLIAYYRGYCRQALGGSGAQDFDEAAGQSTTYVFPNRPETRRVLRAALAHDPDDETARFLLGSWYLSGGMAEKALAEWEIARTLDPSIPVLHFNMGYTVLRTGGPPESAVALFREGTAVDPLNVGLYFGLDEAMTAAGKDAGERADALLAYPDYEGMPAALVYRLARLLAEARRFDEAERLFFGRFFPSEEGGINVREVYLEVKVGRATALADEGRCSEALDLLEGLATPVPDLAFTQDGLQQFIDSERFQEMIGAVRAVCPG